MKLTALIAVAFSTLGFVALPAFADDTQNSAMPPLAPPIESLDSALRHLQQAQTTAPSTDASSQVNTVTESCVTIKSSNTSEQTSAPTAATQGAAQGLPSPMLYVYEFSAKWCPSCRQLAPIVESTASKYKDFIQFIPVNVDNDASLSQKLNIAQIPTVIVMDRSGRTLNRLVGLQQGQQLDAILEHYKEKAVAAVSIPH